MEVQLQSVSKIIGRQFYLHKNTAHNFIASLDIPLSGAILSQAQIVSSLATIGVRVTVRCI